MKNKDKRYIQIYTGNGKGKTTAAIGQVIRAAGMGLHSLIIMFMKDYPYNELRSLERFGDLITVEQYGDDDFVLNKQPPSKKDIATAHRAVKRAEEAVFGGQFDVVVLDEICVTTYFDLLTGDDLLPLLRDKPDDVELILTGRYCPDEWIRIADLVTEMREVKHYYQRGVLSRKGFES